MWQPKNKTSAAADWLEATARLPVAFTQVREDPAIDVELVRGLNRAARVLMIASGGETAAMLSKLPIAELRLVDVNRSQLNLTRLKLQLLTTANRSERLRLLGHLPMDADKRSGELARRLSALKLPADALGPPALVARHGLDHCGRYEWLFAHASMPAGSSRCCAPAYDACGGRCAGGDDSARLGSGATFEKSV